MQREGKGHLQQGRGAIDVRGNSRKRVGDQRKEGDLRKVGWDFTKGSRFKEGRGIKGREGDLRKVGV